MISYILWKIFFFLKNFAYMFNRNLLNILSVPADTVLCVGETALNKIDKNISPLVELIFSE